MGNVTLWRVEGGVTSATSVRSEALVLGMRRHLDYAPLYSSLVHINGRQQAYIALEGCPGCVHGRCDVGCRAEALRRTLRAAYGESLSLSIVRRGLAPRPYQRCYVLNPLVVASVPLLDGTLVKAWPEARLTLAWNGSVKTKQALSAVLYVGADGPDPCEVVADAGWKAQKRPILPMRGVPNVPTDDLVAVGARLLWPRDPWLLLPAPAQEEADDQLAHALADEVVL